MKKNILLFSIGFLIISCKKEVESNPQIKNDSIVVYTVNKYLVNKARVELQSSLKKEKTDIIFLGDSKTEGFPVSEMFSDLRIKNRGIGGNTTQDVLDRLETITEGRPQKIFLEIGLNDLSNNLSPNKAFNNFSLICSRIKKETPETTLYVQSITPTGQGQKGLNPKINQYNSLVYKYCSENNITYINIHHHFLKNQELNKAYTIDGVHLNSKGYFLWKDLISNYIYN